MPITVLPLRRLISQRKERAQPIIAQEKPTPDQHTDKDWKEDGEPRIPDTHMGSDCTAQIGCQQDRAENRSTRNDIDDSTEKQDDPETGMTPSEYPSRTVASTTGVGFTNFMMPSKSRNSAGRPLVMRPAHSIFCETGTI